MSRIKSASDKSAQVGCTGHGCKSVAPIITVLLGMMLCQKLVFQLEVIAGVHVGESATNDQMHSELN